MRNLMALLKGLLLLAVLGGGCLNMNIKTIPYVPDPSVKGIPSGKAREALAQGLVKGRSWLGDPIEDVQAGPARLRYRVNPPRGSAYDADFGYKEVGPTLFEVVSTPTKDPWGRFGLTFKRGDEAISDAAVYFQTLGEAQQAADAFTSLASAGS